LAIEPVWTLWSKEKPLVLEGNGTPALQLAARRYTVCIILKMYFNSYEKL
jgi:hypothetical protein